MTLSILTSVAERADRARNFVQNQASALWNEMEWACIIVGKNTLQIASYAYRLMPVVPATTVVTATALGQVNSLLMCRAAQKYLPKNTKLATVVCVLLAAPTSLVGGIVVPTLVLGAGIAAAAVAKKIAPTCDSAAANTALVGMAYYLNCLSPLGAVCTLGICVGPQVLSAANNALHTAGNALTGAYQFLFTRKTTATTLS